MHRLFSTAVLAPYEVTFAVTPVLLVAAVTGAAVAGRGRRGAPTASFAARSAVVLALSALVLLVLPVRTAHGSLWELVWRLPGATAIRAIDRLQVVTGLVVTLALVAAATELSGRLASRRRRRSVAPGLRILGVALLALVVVEQANTTQRSVINRPAQLSLLHAATAPPSECRSFFVVAGRSARSPYFVYQVDAMLISEERSIPTLNGYTAHNPAGWHLEYPDRAGYAAAVGRWAVHHGIARGLCQFDLTTATWRRYPVRGA